MGAAELGRAELGAVAEGASGGAEARGGANGAGASRTGTGTRIGTGEYGGPSSPESSRATANRFAASSVTYKGNNIYRHNAMHANPMYTCIPLPYLKEIL